MNHHEYREIHNAAAALCESCRDKCEFECENCHIMSIRDNAAERLLDDLVVIGDKSPDQLNVGDVIQSPDTNTIGQVITIDDDDKVYTIEIVNILDENDGEEFEVDMSDYDDDIPYYGRFSLDTETEKFLLYGDAADSGIALYEYTFAVPVPDGMPEIIRVVAEDYNESAIAAAKKTARSKNIESAVVDAIDSSMVIERRFITRQFI